MSNTPQPMSEETLAPTIEHEQAIREIVEHHTGELDVKYDYESMIQALAGNLLTRQLEARIEQAKRTRGTMYINPPSLGYSKVGTEIALLEALLANSQSKEK